MTADLPPNAVSGRGPLSKRLPALVAATSLCVGALFVSPLAEASTPMAAAAGPELICASDYVYSVSDSGVVTQVHEGGTPVLTTIGSWALQPEEFDVNGLGISADGSVLYAHIRSGDNSQNIGDILRYVPATESWDRLGVSFVTGLDRGLVAGAVNPANGQYYFGGYTDAADGFDFRLFSFDPATSSFTTLGSFDSGLELSESGNGDIDFDDAGNLFVLVSADDTVQLFTIAAADVAGANGGTIDVSASERFVFAQGSSPANGMAFDADGSIYLGTTGTVQRYDPSTWNLLSTPTSDLDSSFDLGSCGSPSTLTVQKDVVERVGTSDQFTLTVSADDGRTVAEVTTTGSTTGIQADQVGPIPVVAGSTLTFSEAMPTGDLSAYSTTWICRDGGGATVSSGVGASGEVTIPAADSTEVTCVLRNAVPETLGSLVIDKQYGGDGGIRSGVTFEGTYSCEDGGPSGTWTISDDGQTTISDIPAGLTCTVTEDVQPLLDNPSGYLVDDSYSWSLIGLVDGPQPIVAGQSSTATVFNSTVRAAQPLVIEKQALPSFFDGERQQWYVSYNVIVTSVFGENVYTLTDDAADLPPDVTGGDWDVAFSVSGSVPSTGTVDPDWSGSGVLATGSFTGPGAHAYQLSRWVTVDPDATAADLTCGEGPTDPGLWNTATLDDGTRVTSDDACVSIQRPGVAVSKSVRSSTPLAGGDWQVVYDIVVTNESDNVAAQYALTDQLRFGEGIEILEAAWVDTSSGSTPAAFTTPLDGPQTLVTSAVVDPSQADRYAVTVRATVPAELWTDPSAALVCADDGSLDSGAFLNTATVAAGGTTATTEACAAPDRPGTSTSTPGASSSTLSSTGLDAPATWSLIALALGALASGTIAIATQQRRRRDI